jgi:hypothetical protein
VSGVTDGDDLAWRNGPGAGQRAATAREAGFGSFEATRVILPGYDFKLWHIKVNRADPRILISGPMMDLIRGGGGIGWEIDGDLLRFTAVNGTWVYRIGEYLEDRRAWVAEWPD